MNKYDLIVIGGGCAGLSAAIAATKAGITSILLLESDNTLGGILRQCIHSGFGLDRYSEDLTGPEFARRLISEFNSCGAFAKTGVSVMSISPDRIVTYSGKTGLEQACGTCIILASGCRETPIGALSIPGTRPSGIFTAGQAQKMINLGGYDIGDNIVILGSGDVGMIVARRLSILGKRVIAVIEKEHICGGLERNRINCLEKYSIPLYTDTCAVEILGSDRITAVAVSDKSGNITRIPCSTLITSVGLVPERGLIDKIRGGALSGFLTCGNCRFVHDTADAASSDGETAGAFAAEYIKTGFLSTMPAPPAEKQQHQGIICTDCPRQCNLRKYNGKLLGGKCGKYK